MANYTIIRSQEQYDNYSHIQAQLAFSGKSDQETIDELELLALLTERYISEKYQWKEMEPIPFLEYLMKEHQLEKMDLAIQLGIKLGHLEDILNYRRGLSISTILKLSERFKLNPEIFNKPYKLKSKFNKLFKDSCVMNSIKELSKSKPLKSQSIEWGV